MHVFGATKSIVLSALVKVYTSTQMDSQILVKPNTGNPFYTEAT